MESQFVVPSASVAQARDGLPALLDAARHHVPQIVTRHERDEVVLVALADLREFLRDHRFETEVVVHPGEVTVVLPQFAIIGIGETVDGAVEDTLEKLRGYCLQYVKRYEFYRETDRRSLLPLVARFLLTPREDQQDLLLESDEPAIVRA